MPSQESVTGKYKLTEPELSIRTGIEIFIIKKGHVIEVLQDDPQHGNVLIKYSEGSISWKHISVLKNFKRV